MPGFDAVVKFRCYRSLLDRLTRLAVKHRRELSDYLRVATEDYVEAEEKRLGLKPLTPDEIQSFLMAAEKYSAEPVVHPKVKPITYELRLPRRKRDSKR